MNSTSTRIAGAVFGFLTVALGAFGAHALKEMLVASGRLETYELATRYMMFHAIALVVIGVFNHKETSLVRFASLAMTFGVVLFSGSLYMLALVGITSFAYITPIGGLSLLTGWGLLIAAFLRKGK